MRKAKLYQRLRTAMYERGYTASDMADLWNAEHDGERLKYHNWLAPYLNGHIPWRMDIVYWIMDTLGIPHEQMSYYFPKNGIDRG